VSSRWQKYAMLSHLGSPMDRLQRCVQHMYGGMHNCIPQSCQHARIMAGAGLSTCTQNLLAVMVGNGLAQAFLEYRSSSFSHTLMGLVATVPRMHTSPAPSSRHTLATFISGSCMQQTRSRLQPEMS
jgi:hypothetical protein